MLTTDRVAGAALVLVALLALADSRGLPLGTVRNPGPAYLPVLLVGGLLILGALIGVAGGRAPRLGAVGWGEWRRALAITIVAPFPPGGVADLTARPVAAALEKALKSPVGVVNLAEGVRKVGKVEPK